MSAPPPDRAGDRSDRPAAARVLVVDDDPTVVRILRSMLDLEGYATAGETTAVGLVERVAASPPDLLLLDVHMPGMSGLDVLDGLREVAGEAPPAIMLTGEADNRELVAETLKRGALEYLVKPVGMDRLHGAVRSVLRLSALARENRALRAEIERTHAPAATGKAPDDSGEGAWCRDFVLASSDGVLFLDGELRVRFLNRRAATLTGASPEAARGKAIGDLLAGSALALLDRLAAAGGGEGEVELAPGDGPRRCVRVRIARGGPGYAVVLGEGPAPRRRQRRRADGDEARVNEVLNACRGNRSEAARRLGIGRTTLWRRLAKGER